MAPRPLDLCAAMHASLWLEVSYITSFVQRIANTALLLGARGQRCKLYGC